MRTIPFFLNCWLWRRRSGVLPRRPWFPSSGFLGDARGCDYTGNRWRVTPLWLGLLALSACSTADLPAPSQTETKAMAEQCTLYLVRHAEKQQIAGEKDPPLSAQGERRAQALAQRLGDKAIERLFATSYKRTQLTLTPLATASGKSIEIYDGRQSAAFLTNLLVDGCKGQLIIAGHSNTLPELLRAAGINETASEFDESRYGELFIVERQLQHGMWQAQLRIERFGD